MDPAYDIFGDRHRTYSPKGNVPPAAGRFTAHFLSIKEMKAEINKLKKSPFPIDKKKLAFYEKELKKSK